MSDSIIFLGTGGDAAVVGKQIRSSAGIILQIHGNQFHLDPGPGALVALNHERINPREHTCIFVSNETLINSGDANAVISAMTHDGLDKRGLLVSTENIINSENQSCVKNFYKQCTEKSLAMRVGSKIGINEIDIIATPTINPDESAIGFKFITPKYSVSYTSDTEYFPELADAHKGVDVLIINCTNVSEVKEDGLMNIDEAIALIQKVKPKIAILTHFGIKVMQDGPLNVSRRVQSETNVQVLAAKDGMSVHPQTFASKNRQQRLRKK